MLYQNQHYEVQQITDDLRCVEGGGMNYQVINKSNGAVECATKTLPGALSAAEELSYMLETDFHLRIRQPQKGLDMFNLIGGEIPELN